MITNDDCDFWCDRFIDIATEQSFRYMKLTDAKIWNSKNASLFLAFANQVTYKSRDGNGVHELKYS